MSTCSTATSACHQAHGKALSQPTGCNHDDDAVALWVDRLERRMTDLEQYWNGYKTKASRSTPRHRSDSSTCDGGTPSSAVVTGAGLGAPDPFFPIFLGRSPTTPRKLLSSLQQAGSSGAGASDGCGKGRARRYEEDASSIAAVASTSCSCQCSIPHCPCGCCCCGDSSSSSGSTAATSLFSLGESAVTCEMRKTEAGRWAWRFAAVAVVGVAVLGAMAAVVVDDGYVEFLVPT